MKTICCPSCNWPINKLEPGEYLQINQDVRDAVDDDEASHRIIHDEKLQAFLSLGFQPRNRRAVKEAQAEADKLIASSEFADRYQGGVQLIQTFFERSLDRGCDEGYWQQHPQSVDAFTALMDLPDLLPPDVASDMSSVDVAALRPVINNDTSWLWLPQQFRAFRATPRDMSPI